MVRLLKLDRIYSRTMATGTRRALLGEGPDPRSKLYWLDIDVNFHELLRQQRMIPSDIRVHRPASSLQYSVLQGAGAVTNALSVGEKGTTFTILRSMSRRWSKPTRNITLAERYR